MHEKQNELSSLYHMALQQYLHQGVGTDMQPARDLGRHAMKIGLDTLDMARIHEIALVSLVLPKYSSIMRNSLMGRAGVFFAEAITPIEQTHRGAREANIHLNQVVQTLGHRTLELANSVEVLKQEISRRQAVEESLRASEQTTSGLLDSSRQMQDELRQLSRQLLTVQEEERMKISRELHDVIAQTLTGINLRLEVLKAEASASSKPLQQKIATTQRLVEESVDIVHRFARELRPTVLDDLGLIPALKSFSKDFTANTGVRVSLKVSARIERSNSTIRTVLYRVAQEALNNVARHAKSSQAEVTVRCLDGLIYMAIADNGQGFHVAGTPDATKPKRLGLLGMRERIEMIGGTFSLESAPGKGTTISVEIPQGSPPAKNLPSKPQNATTTCECS